MLPTLSVFGDTVLLSRFYRRGRDVSIGDIVSFESVVDNGGAIMKRVMGMPGDYVLRDTPGKGDAMIQVCLFSCLGWGVRLGLGFRVGDREWKWESADEEIDTRRSLLGSG